MKLTLDYILDKGLPYLDSVMLLEAFSSCSLAGTKITKALVDDVCRDYLLANLKAKRITRNSTWQTAEGNIIKLKDLEDTHLANILYSFPNNHAVNKVLLRIAKERGLTQKFLDKAPYPFKNKDNKWEVWDIKKGTRRVFKNKPIKK